MLKLAFIGGGSVNWSPGLIRDILLTEGLPEIEFRLLDLVRENAETIKRFAEKIRRDWGIEGATFRATEDPDEALADADFVIITISTGGLDAMEHDLAIPERYGILQTVGDTVGPGGWARALRNIPVFAGYAERIHRLAPRAVILNYTNPMAALTSVLAHRTAQRIVGLCHGLFECYGVLQRIFGLDSEKQIKLTIAGVNHFFWILDLRICGEDGYRLLRERMRGKTFDSLLRESYTDGAGFSSRKLVASELFEQFGYLPYVGDRHTCEFFGQYLTDPRNLEKHKLVRTTIADRRKGLARQQDWVQRVISGAESFAKERSRESAADIIAAIALGGEIIDVVNLPNRGQVANLPSDAVVETLGVVNALGFTPLTAGGLPPSLLPLVAPHAMNQQAIVDAALQGDRKKALDALARDPLCRGLTRAQSKEMGLALLEAHKEYLPQFFD